jgi:hypothetical protein
MNTEHTPGPWKVNYDGTILTEDKTGPCSHEIIAQMPVWFGTAQKGHVTQDHLAANARLIAAAPELLAALEFMVRVGPSGIIGQQTARERAIEAIAKAKGAQ